MTYNVCTSFGSKSPRTKSAESLETVCPGTLCPGLYDQGLYVLRCLNLWRFIRDLYVRGLFDRDLSVPFTYKNNLLFRRVQKQSLHLLHTAPGKSCKSDRISCPLGCKNIPLFVPNMHMEEVLETKRSGNSDRMDIRNI